MRTGILIPFRGTKKDKSRLRNEISEEIVDELLERMIQHVIDVCMESEFEKEIYILTKNETIELEGDYRILQDQGEDLNDSINKARGLIEEDTIIIIMADLPFLNSRIVEQIINSHKEDNQIVIAPSDDNGTSILCFNTKSNFPFVFGQKSSIRFEELFKKNNIDFLLLEYEETYRDIDTFKDLIEIENFKSVPEWLIEIIEEVK
ncbi:MAG: 2-phospho-L-lactate guanylyltransferase [Candidatus Heimdallarchaeaceae archaeon]|jgi:2-phospho-L-lactate guanylyltransferase